MSTVGTLQGRFAFVRFGSGPAPLVVLPGLAFDNAAPGPRKPGSTAGPCAGWLSGARSPS